MLPVAAGTASSIEATATGWPPSGIVDHGDPERRDDRDDQRGRDEDRRHDGAPPRGLTVGGVSRERLV